MSKPRSLRYKGIFLIPNLITTASMLLALYAVVLAAQGAFVSACVSILICTVLDMLDGSAARITGTDSEFGKQLDSMSDLLAFGMAPSVLLYFWSMQYFGKWGWFCTAFFMITVALRLARFNIQPPAHRQYFQGLPSPVGAGLVVLLIWMTEESLIPYSSELKQLSSVWALLVAATMVSNFRYAGFKSFHLEAPTSFVVLLLAVTVVLLLILFNAALLFSIGFLYLLSGPMLTLVGIAKARAKRRRLLSKRLKKSDRSR